MTTLLEIEDVHRGYGSLVAVGGVSLAVPVGVRHAIIGSNGAGKTTLLNHVAGLTRPDRGRIRLAGRDITRRGPTHRSRLGINRTHQRPAVWPSLTAAENIIVAGWRATGGVRATLTPGRYRTQVVEPAVRLLEQIDLAASASVPAGQLSHGQRRQLEIAIALAGRPRLLLLDEPGAGLSPAELHRLTGLLASLPREIAVLLVEHHLDLVYSVADQVTVLASGRIVRTGTPAEIRDGDGPAETHDDGPAETR